MSGYPLGTTVRIGAKFRKPLPSRELVDPTTVTLTLRSPGPTPTETTATVTKEAVGTYFAEVTPAAAGTWHYRWKGTGAASVTSPDKPLVIDGSEFDP